MLSCPTNAGFGLDHIDAHGAEALNGIIGSNGTDDRMDVIVDLAEIDLGLARGDAELQAPRQMAWACFPAAIIALDGTQP
jgi:hypothetical protein